MDDVYEARRIPRGVPILFKFGTIPVLGLIATVSADHLHVKMLASEELWRKRGGRPCDTEEMFTIFGLSSWELVPVAELPIYMGFKVTWPLLAQTIKEGV